LRPRGIRRTWRCASQRVSVPDVSVCDSVGGQRIDSDRPTPPTAGIILPAPGAPWELFACMQSSRLACQSGVHACAFKYRRTYIYPPPASAWSKSIRLNSDESELKHFCMRVISVIRLPQFTLTRIDPYSVSIGWARGDVAAQPCDVGGLGQIRRDRVLRGLSSRFGQKMAYSSGMVEPSRGNIARSNAASDPTAPYVFSRRCESSANSRPRRF
jgi:hypothetical protein